MGLLTIKRAKTAAYSARRVKIFVDDQEVGIVGNGQSLSVNISPGFHVIELKMGVRSIGETQINVNDDYSSGVLFTLSATTGTAVFESANSGSVSSAQSKNVGCATILIVVFLIALSLWIALPNLSVVLRFIITPE